MKRNMDLLREILLYLERQDGPNVFRSGDVEIEGYEKDLTTDHIFLLIDSGHIEEKGLSQSGLTSYTYCRMTTRGYDFLDSVRDSEIWRKTKSAVGEAKGFTLEILADVAKGFIRTQLKKHTGVEI